MGFWIDLQLHGAQSTNDSSDQFIFCKQKDARNVIHCSYNTKKCSLQRRSCLSCNTM